MLFLSSMQHQDRTQTASFHRLLQNLYKVLLITHNVICYIVITQKASVVSLKNKLRKCQTCLGSEK